MKTSHILLTALILSPCALWAATYPGSFAKTENSGDHLVTYAVNIPKLQRNDVAMVKSDANAKGETKQLVAFSADSVPAKLLKHLAESGDIMTMSYKQDVLVESGLYAFSSKKTLDAAHRYLQNVSPDQANVLKINPDNAALMVG